MKARIITSATLILAAVAILYFRGVVLLAAAMFLLAASLVELYRAFAHRDIKVHIWPVAACGLAAIIVEFYFGILVALAVLGLLFVICLAIFMFMKSESFESTIISGFAMLYPAIPILCVGSWGFQDASLILGVSGISPGSAFGWLVGAVVAAIGCDTFAFIFGSWLGKHKLCPRLSPNKSVEGALAGLVGGVAFAFLIRQLLIMIFGQPLFSCSVAVLIGLVGAGASIIGDLFASSIKRYCGIKDFSSFLPGHGGILDRLDGIMFSCMTLYIIYSVVYCI